MAGRFRRVSSRRLAACGAVFAWAVAVPAMGQVSTAATHVLGPVPTARPHADLDALTAHFNAGEWTRLHSLAAEIIEAVRGRHGAVSEALDLRRRHVVLLWVGSDAFGKSTLMRVVARRPPADAASPDLSGAREVHEVLLARSASGQSASVYTSTKQKDQAADALPGFVQAIAGPLFGRFAVLAGTEQVPAAPTVWITVSRVGLPFTRATVKVKSMATDPWLDLDVFASALRGRAAQVRFDTVPTSPCAREHATLLAGALAETARGHCAPSPWNPSACRTALDETMAQRLAAQTCGRPARPREENTPLQRVDKEFRSLVSTSLANGADLDLTFRNRPLTRVAFGGGSAVIVDARFDRPRVKLDDGVLVADPLNRVMTMAVVNVSPGGYDAEADRMSVHERVRLFAGAVLTPDFGIAGGLNVLLARGIGVSVGVAVLFARGAEPSQVGQPAADSADPFRLAVATAPFVGITYNYK